MNWLLYIKITLSFSVLYSLYWLFLRKTTFHRTNRALLLSVLIFSVVIPLTNFEPQQLIAKNSNAIFFEIGEFDGFMDTINQSDISKHENKFTFLNILNLIYWIGVVVFGFKFFFQLNKLIRCRKINKAYKKGKFTFVFPSIHMAPFSFFYWIFIPLELRNKPEANSIIEHEKIHAKQLHTLDVLITEIFCTIFWFVPFVYSFKNSIKSVHEFLADHKVASNSEQKINYLKLLANETEKYTLIGLSSNFYCKTLKNRITMITKKQSSIISSVRYFVLIPVLVFLVQAFSLHPKTDRVTVLGSKTATKVTVSFIKPIDADKCTISSGFGMRMHPTKKKEMMHNGIDFKAKTGTPVKASANGKIVRKEFLKGGYGNVIAIEHANGYYSLYAQLSEFKTDIGATVKQGDVIGLVGSSGLSTGPHLHFEIRKDGDFVNPEEYINK